MPQFYAHSLSREEKSIRYWIQSKGAQCGTPRRLGGWVNKRKCEREPFKIEAFGFKEASQGLKYPSHSAIPPTSREPPSRHRI